MNFLHRDEITVGWILWDPCCYKSSCILSLFRRIIYIIFMIVTTVMLELLTDCHGIHLSCTQICSAHHVYIRDIYLVIYIPDLTAVSTKPRQSVARV